MPWKRSYTTVLVVAASLFIVSSLFHLHNWWAYLSAVLYLAVLSAVVRVPRSANWNVEKRGWQVFWLGWGALFCLFPLLTIFFPTSREDCLDIEAQGQLGLLAEQKVSACSGNLAELGLDDRALQMGPAVALGLAGIISTLIIASRRRKTTQETTI